MDRSDDYHTLVQIAVEQSAELNGGHLAWTTVLRALDPLAIKESDERQSPRGLEFLVAITLLPVLVKFDKLIGFGQGVVTVDDDVR